MPEASEPNSEESLSDDRSWDDPIELERIAQAVKEGNSVQKVTVRTLLSWFASQRRGSFIVVIIRRRLKQHGIKTEPDFNSVWIGSEISFALLETKSETQPTLEAKTSEAENLEISPDLATEPTYIGGASDDPTYRIGKLDAANKPVVSVTPNHSIQQAITLMLMHGFSQLPVMQNVRDVKGILTWESIGSRMVLGSECKEARDCMVSAQIISSERSLFAAIEVIEQHQYVLVQAPDRTITGIVTGTDLSQQFQQLTEPFLLLGEIEQHIRGLLVNKYTANELKLACDPSDQEREVQSVADLTMGEYIRLLENPDNWERIKVQIDRKTFVDQVKSVKRIRNDVMHFDPDPLGQNDLQMLRQFATFMQNLRKLI